MPLQLLATEDDATKLHDLTMRFMDCANEAIHGVVPGSQRINDRFVNAVDGYVRVIAVEHPDRRVWGRARRAAEEAASTFDEIRRQGLIGVALHRKVRQVLSSIIALLARLILAS